MIVVLDYGMGNLRSVLNALQAVGAEARLGTGPADVAAAGALVLPGVGAFGEAMQRLAARGLVAALRDAVGAGGTPLLGICLGMQLLATTGTEHGEHEGLGLMAGRVVPFDFPPEHRALRVPHVGWNDVRFRKTDGLHAGMGEAQAFYFTHSYHLRPDDPADVAGVCDYGIDFVASVERGNVSGAQFHPEKSHQMGLRLIRNWLEGVARA